MEWLVGFACATQRRRDGPFAYASQGGSRNFWDLVGDACFCPVLPSVGNRIAESLNFCEFSFLVDFIGRLNFGVGPFRLGIVLC